MQLLTTCKITLTLQGLLVSLSEKNGIINHDEDHYLFVDCRR